MPVEAGYLHGEHGTREKASWLSLAGPIAPDGSAPLAANGFTAQNIRSAACIVGRRTATT